MELDVAEGEHKVRGSHRAGRGQGHCRGALSPDRRARAERGRGRGLSGRRGACRCRAFDPKDIPDPKGKAGRVRVPVRPSLGDRVAGRAGRRACPTTSTSPAASSAGRPPACRPRPAADRKAMTNAMTRPLNRVFTDLPITVFEVMSQLAREHNAINLGQGFPDDPGPEDVRRKAADAVIDGYNQYPPMMGLPELRQAVSAHYRHWHGLTLDPDERGHGDLRRHRSDRRRAVRPDRAGRRGGRVRAGL